LASSRPETWPRAAGPGVAGGKLRGSWPNRVETWMSRHAGAHPVQSTTPSSRRFSRMLFFLGAVLPFAPTLRVAN
jgi:hypothetical protein